MAEGFRNLRNRGKNLRKKCFLGDVLFIKWIRFILTLSDTKNTGFKKISQERGQIYS